MADSTVASYGTIALEGVVPQRTTIAVAGSTVKLSFHLTYRDTRADVASVTSVQLSVLDRLGNTVLSVTSLTNEGAGLFSYACGPTIFADAGLYKVTLVVVAGTGETLTQQFSLLTVTGF